MDLLKMMLLDSLLESLKDDELERDVDDINSKFNLHFPPDEVDPEEGQFKRPKQKSIYSICHKAGLGGAASKFGFSSEQLGKRLNLEQMGEQLEDARDTPEDVATVFVCLEFETSQDVLKGAHYMAALDISCDPLVRKHIHDAYMDKGVISTWPTPDGNTMIDSFHQFSSVKWLCDKESLVGELIGRSQREERLEFLENCLDELKLIKESYWWNLDLRRFGSGIYGAMALARNFICSITGVDCVGGFHPSSEAILD